jgi:integration host factor subunit beta
MNKSDLMEELSIVRGITLEQAEIVVNSVFEIMAEKLANCGRIEIRGFGSFNVKDYDGSSGDNPKTDEPVGVGPMKLPIFRVGKDLHERLNEVDELEEQDGFVVAGQSR